MKELVKVCMEGVYQRLEKEVVYICNSPVMSRVMLGEYKNRNFNIEDYPSDQKQILWDEVKILFPTKTKQELIDACKIIYTITQLHEKNIY